VRTERANFCELFFRCWRRKTRLLINYHVCVVYSIIDAVPEMPCVYNVYTASLQQQWWMNLENLWRVENFHVYVLKSCCFNFPHKNFIVLCSVVCFIIIFCVWKRLYVSCFIEILKYDDITCLHIFSFFQCLCFSGLFCIFNKHILRKFRASV